MSKICGLRRTSWAAARAGAPAVVALAVTLAAGCDGATEREARSGTAKGPAEARETFSLESYRLVDLSHPYDATTLYWPTSPSRFESETLAEGYTEAGFYYLARRFATPEHGGTHMDAPVHFAEHGWSLDEIPVERLVAPARVIDVSGEADADPDFRLSRADVERWEAENGEIAAGSIVLLHTGWSRRWADESAYYGRPEGGGPLDLHFPSFGADAARLLVEERRVAMLGVDTASIDFGPSEDFPVHQIAGAANVPGLENLTRLEELPATGAWVFALPMKIAGGSGAPVRVVALVPR